MLLSNDPRNLYSLKDTVIDESFCDLQATCYIGLKGLFNERILLLKLLRAKDEKCEIGFVNFSKLVIY